MATKRKSPSQPAKPAKRDSAPAVQAGGATADEAGLQSYTVVHTPVAHDGQRYAAGETIELDKAGAARLGDNLAPINDATTKEPT